MRVWRERYHWFLGFAVLCLVAEMLLPDSPRPRPAQTARASGPGWRKVAVILAAFLLPASAPASGTGAFDKYQSGDYQAAFDEYNRLAAQKTNDYRLHYNAGTSAYRAKDLDAAEKQLGEALNTPEIVSDLKAQEHAYFNLGNTLYQLGDLDADSAKKQERWEQAVTNYSRALRLSTNDVDAKNNLAFVKQKLEELKQQQQQQKNQNNDNKNQDQKDQDQQNQQNQKNQDQKNQQNKDQQNQQQQNQQNQQQQQKSSPQDQQDKKDQQKQAQQQKDKDQQNKTGQAKSGQQGKDQDKNQQQTAAVPAQMTRQQAQQMLDAEKDDEKALIFNAQNHPSTADPKIKDW
jgi:Ca-activated chloride channel family protein